MYAVYKPVVATYKSVTLLNNKMLDLGAELPSFTQKTVSGFSPDLILISFGWELSQSQDLAEGQIKALIRAFFGLWLTLDSFWLQ